MTTADNLQFLHVLASLFFAGAAMASLGATIEKSWGLVMLTGVLLFFGMWLISAVA